jgi:hydrogenase assembly chaperone HypC/HupF
VQTRIIGCGNLDRGDDAAGVLVARRLRTLGIDAEEQSGESFSLMDSWQGFESVILVDALCSDQAPGEVKIWDACASPLPKAALQCSTHAFGLYEAVELARTLGRLPDKLLIYGIEGDQFVPGTRPSAEVEKAVELVAQQIAAVLTNEERATTKDEHRTTQDWNHELPNYDPPGGCRMCLAIPGKIVEISSDNKDSALVDVAGVRRRIDLSLVRDDKPAPGDWVLIHVGFAMSKISEQDALDQMHTLQMLGESEAAIQEVRGYGVDDPPPQGFA